jgi:hypothetical protein
MANTTTATCLPLCPSLEMAWRDVDSSFERFCLTAGIGAVEQMLREDAQQLTGAPHRRGGGRVGHRSNPTCHFRVFSNSGRGVKLSMNIEEGVTDLFKLQDQVVLREPIVEFQLRCRIAP